MVKTMYRIEHKKNNGSRKKIIKNMNNPIHRKNSGKLK